MLKQAQNSPIPVDEQVAIVYAGINGFLDDLEVSDVRTSSSLSTSISS